MKLYFMKQKALDTLKANLNTCYTNYYTCADAGWLKDICGEDIFEEFRDIPTFQLTSLTAGLSKGEIDLENCKAVYKNLMFLTDSEAADERLWAGLTHTVFYDYMREKWDMKNPQKGIPEAKKAKGAILTRFFFEGSTKGGFYRNTLAKCWWVGYKTYDAGNTKNPFAKLDALGSNDITSKISEIFYSYNYSSNPTILNGICKAFQHYKDEGIRIDVRHQLRPVVQYLNVYGGSIVLDCLDEDDIMDIVIDVIDNIRSGNQSGLEIDNSKLEDDEETANVPVSKELQLVTYNCRVDAVETATGKARSLQIGNEPLGPLPKELLGKNIGYTFMLKSVECKIVKIELI